MSSRSEKNRMELQMSLSDRNYTKLLTAASIIVAGILAGCGMATDGAAEADRTYVIKFPHVVAPSTPKGQAANRFASVK